MADENKKAIIKSEFNDVITEINETIDNLLYDKGVFRTFPFQMLMDGVNLSGITTELISLLSLEVNGEFIDTLDDNVYFEGTLKLKKREDEVLDANKLLTLLSSAYFMTDCANTGTTATTTTGIQINILSRWRQNNNKVIYFGGCCYSPAELANVNDVQIIILFHISYDKIIIKGFRIFTNGSTNALYALLSLLNENNEVSIYVKIPLFIPTTITYEE